MRGSPSQQPQPWQNAPPAPSPSRSGSRGATIVAIVVVVVIVLALGAYLAARSSGSSPSNGGNNSGGGGGNTATVDITAVNFDFTGGCWTSSSATGGVVNAGQPFSTTWTMSYSGGLFQASSCTITSVSISTSGFSITSDNVPVTVDAGGTQTLTVVIGTPSAAFTGVVQLEGTVTTA